MIIYGLFVKGVLLICTVSLATGFIPTAFRLSIADLVLTRNGQSFTHADMTRDAVLAALADVLIDNPSSANENGAQDVRNLGSLSVSCLIDAYYGRLGDVAAVRGQQKVRLERAIDAINDFNARTDTDEEDSAAAHFDSEQFAEGQQRLVDFREIVAMEISRGNHVRPEDLWGDCSIHYKIFTVILTGLKLLSMVELVVQVQTLH